ncbi:MAG: hypothetical protein GY799_31640 [Desulfobulbaceae bacterium]|nr:hypothetical protein [Desulfobulbaceae bacterium]
MPKPLSTPERKPRNSRTLSPQERRDKDRRKVLCDGYTYVPMVGWYCRRTQIRRNK